MTEDRNQSGKPWRFRRRLAISVLSFCAMLTVTAVFLGVEMASAVLPSVAGTVAIVLGAYFAGAVYHDTRRNE